MQTIATDQDIQDMARGAVFLGSGGGGDPYVGELYLRQQLAEGRNARIVKATELADDAFVISIAGVGAPTVLVEHLVSTNTLLRLLEASEKFYGRKVDALISAEIGGANSMFPLALWSARRHSGHRRRRHGARVPAPRDDDVQRLRLRGVPEPADGRLRQRRARARDDRPDRRRRRALDLRVARLDDLRQLLSDVRQAGEGTRRARHDLAHARDRPPHPRARASRRPTRSATCSTFWTSRPQHRHARELFNGRIVDVRHETRDGWHWGQALINSGRGDEPEFSIEIQNEYLIARHHGRTVTVVPDLIAVLDAESAEPLTAEMLSYGQRVTVIGYSAAPIMRRAESLEGVRPAHVRHRRGLSRRRAARAGQRGLRSVAARNG